MGRDRHRLDWKKDRERLTLIDKGQNEIEKGRLKKIDVN